MLLTNGFPVENSRGGNGSGNAPSRSDRPAPAAEDLGSLRVFREVTPATQINSIIKLPTTRSTVEPDQSLVKAATVDFAVRDSTLLKAIKLSGARETLSAFTGNTGSAGNFTSYLGMGRAGRNEILAVDCGLSPNKLRESFATHGLQLVSSELKTETLEDLKAPGVSKSCWWNHLLITHLHSDHFNEGTAQLCIQYGVTVYIPPDARQMLMQEEPIPITRRKILAALDDLEKAGLLEVFHPGTTKTLGGFEVTCASANHDIPANAYLINYGSLSAFHSGDTGSYSHQMLSLASRAHAWLGDGNYDPVLIDSAQRPEVVTERTKSLVGHMGNHQNGDVLEWISEGANSHTLQVAALLHRSGSTNFQNKKQIVRSLVGRWNDDFAGRHCPAILVAERGPQYLFTLGSNRSLVVKNERSNGDLMRISFGETGLSFSLGRDLMPELTKEQRDRSAEINRVLCAPDLQDRIGKAETNVIWRIPSEMALAYSSPGRHVDDIAGIVLSYCPETQELRISLSAESIRRRLGGDLRQFAEELNDYLSRRSLSSSRAFKFDISDGTLVSRVPVTAEEVLGLTTLVELKAFGGVNRNPHNLRETSIRSIVPDRVALVVTDDVIFPRQKIAEIVVLYRRESGKLRIECGSPASAAEYLCPERTTVFLNAVDRLLGGEKRDTTWSREGAPGTAARLKHSGSLKLSNEQLEQISILAKEHLLWGDV